MCLLLLGFRTAGPLLLKKETFRETDLLPLQLNWAREGHILLSPTERDILYHCTLYVTSLPSVEVRPVDETFVFNTR